MEQSELLRFVVGVVERLGLQYFVTGSVATIYYGEPRFTNDIDFVVALPRQAIAEFCQAFPPDEFYLSEAAVRGALARCSQFNIIHPASGLKVDVMIPDDTPFNRSRFSRATRVRPSPDCEAMFAAPEDVILKKMQYYQEGGSEKHLRDIAGVLKISSGRVDRAYVAEWASRLGVEPIWKAILERCSRPSAQ